LKAHGRREATAKPAADPLARRSGTPGKARTQKDSRRLLAIIEFV
jgi:hypothetical protein